MPRIKAGEQQENVALPTDLVKQVEDYRFDRRLANKKDAYRELIEIGLRTVQQERDSAK